MFNVKILLKNIFRAWLSINILRAENHKLLIFSTQCGCGLYINHDFSSILKMINHLIEMQYLFDFVERQPHGFLAGLTLG